MTDKKDINPTDYIKFPLTFDSYGGQHVYDADNNMIFQVRGWGRLQYREENGKRIHDAEHGAKVQDAIAQWLVDTLNQSQIKR